MTKYLYENFGPVEKLTPDPVQAILDEKQILEAIDEAHHNGLRIRVHLIGPCVLDWTKPPVPTTPG